MRNLHDEYEKWLMMTKERVLEVFDNYGKHLAYIHLDPDSVSQNWMWFDVLEGNLDYRGMSWKTYFQEDYHFSLVPPLIAEMLEATCTK